MSSIGVAKVSIVPYVSLADASVQDHSTMDKQFPQRSVVPLGHGRYGERKRYELIRCLSASATFDFNLHECSTDLWTHPTNVRFPGESDLYWGPIISVESDGNQTTLRSHRPAGGPRGSGNGERPTTQTFASH